MSYLADAFLLWTGTNHRVQDVKACMYAALPSKYQQTHISCEIRKTDQGLLPPQGKQNTVNAALVSHASCEGAFSEVLERAPPQPLWVLSTEEVFMGLSAEAKVWLETSFLRSKLDQIICC